MTDTIKIRVDELKPNRYKNPNKMEPDRYVLLVAAIRRFGFLQPVLVRHVPDSNVPEASFYEIIDGHHRVNAAKEVGLVEVACVDATGKTDEEVQALMVSMNRNRGELDLAIVAAGMVDLTQSGWSIDDLAVTGFTTQEIEDLLASTKIGTEDILDQPIAPPEDDGQDGDDPFVLEISFASKDDMVACRKALKRAAGKGGDLGRGLIKALGLEAS